VTGLFWRITEPRFVWKFLLVLSGCLNYSNRCAARQEMIAVQIVLKNQRTFFFDRRLHLF